MEEAARATRPRPKTRIQREKQDLILDAALDVTELVVEDGVVTRMDGRAAAEFDIIDKFVVAHGLDLKIASEAMATAFHYRYGLPLVGLRYMNVYGPRQDYEGAYVAVIMKMLDAIDRGEGPTIFGDGSEAFDFVAVADCGSANVCAMKADTVARYYNVGTGKRTSLKEMAEMLLQLTGSNQPIRYQERSQATLVRNRIGSPVRATKEIKFTAKVPLLEGLQQLIDWRRAHKSEVEARRAKSRNA